jgi:hemerythrin-like domain-containing protein
MAQDQRGNDSAHGRADGSQGASPGTAVADPFGRLIEDHRMVERLFEQIKSAEGDDRRPLVEQLARALRLHFVLEEDLVYPRVADDLDDEMAEEAEVEHRLARQGLEQVVELCPDQPGFGATLEMLAAGIGHHVDEEESEVFPGLREKLDDAALAQLGEQLMSTRREAEADPSRVEARASEVDASDARAKPNGKVASNAAKANGRRAKAASSGSSTSANGKSARSTSANGKAARSGGGKEPTKKDLLEKAKKAGLEHRSSMTKAELADALAKSSR